MVCRAWGKSLRTVRPDESAASGVAARGRGRRPRPAWSRAERPAPPSARRPASSISCGPSISNGFSCRPSTTIARDSDRTRPAAVARSPQRRSPARPAVSSIPRAHPPRSTFVSRRPLAATMAATSVRRQTTLQVIAEGGNLVVVSCGRCARRSDFDRREQQPGELFARWIVDEYLMRRPIIGQVSPRQKGELLRRETAQRRWPERGRRFRRAYGRNVPGTSSMT